MPFFELAAELDLISKFLRGLSGLARWEELEVGPYMAGMWWCVDWAIQYLPADLLFNHSLFGQGGETDLSSSSQVLVDELMRANGTNKDCLPAVCARFVTTVEVIIEKMKNSRREKRLDFWVKLECSKGSPAPGC